MEFIFSLVETAGKETAVEPIIGVSNGETNVAGGVTMYALVCDTLCQGLTVSAGDFYATRAEAQVEMDDICASRRESAIADGDVDPEDDIDDFAIEVVTLRPDGSYVDSCGQLITVIGEDS